MKFNQEYWISELPEPLTYIPIIELAIPGSHDSFSYTITPHSKVGPDASRLVKCLNVLLGPLMRRFVYKWCITQTCNIQYQLCSGIRYFDLRMATKINNTNFYTVHALYGDPVLKELMYIKTFLMSHSKEILILDFQHFYNFSEVDHNRLSSILKSLFHNMICPKSYPVGKLNLNIMRTNGWQVIIIYRHNIQDDRFWPSSYWPTPWPQTTSYKYLIQFLESGLKQRKQNAGYVTQCLFTPDVKFIMRYFYLNLQTCCLPLNNFLPNWITNQKSGHKHGVNIIKMTSRLLPTIVHEILDNLKINYEQRACIEELLLSLNSVFGMMLTEHALELIDDDSVFLIKCHERYIFQIVGSRGDIYTIMETVNFCTCDFFKHEVLKDKSLCCKHFLAAKIALILKSYKVKNETPDGLTSIMICAYGNQEFE